MNRKLNILLIDEKLDFYEQIRRTPLLNSTNIFYCSSKEDIFNFIRKNRIQVILIDFDQKNIKPASLLVEIKRHDSLLDVIFIGNPIDEEKEFQLINSGATDFITKPFKWGTLEKVIQKIAENRALRKETFRLEKKLEEKYTYHGIIGKSPYMLEIFSIIEKIAKHFTSILITGETGTGKELVARTIHKLSNPTNTELVICDCASIPENLFESELFGYKKGAFTGADRDKKGLFDKANNGIIFLDEIGEIPPPVQAKLLRVLDFHQFRPIGSNETKNINVKVIAATNRNLRECIKNKTFREDLFYRINKVEIYMPSLKERPEDIPLLVRHFLKGINKKLTKNIKGVSRSVQKLFLRYEWPGNARELENVLERASLMTKKEFIDIPDLPKYLQDYFPPPKAIPYINKESFISLDEMEKEYILYLLKTTESNLKKTAEILNVSRTTLYNKLKKYNLPH